MPSGSAKPFSSPASMRPREFPAESVRFDVVYVVGQLHASMRPREFPAESSLDTLAINPDPGLQ